MDAADMAARALFEIVQRSPRREQIALIFENAEGELEIADPHRKQGSDTRATAAFEIPEGSLRAIVHNHPPGRDNDLFSPRDVETAERLGVPMFIEAQSKRGAGELRQYVPGRDYPSSLKVDGRFSEGEPALAEYPLEELESYLMRKLLGREPGDPRGLRR